MNDEWLWLRPDERIVWEGRPRLTTIAGSVGFGLLVIVGSIGLAVAVDPRLATVALLGIPLPAWAYLSVRGTSYVVTNRAIWVKTGVFGRSVRRVTLPRVQNTAYRQSVRGSLFGYGTVTAEIAGGPDVRFRRISDPRTVQEAIDERLGGETGETRNDAVPGSVEQWHAVLATVREIRTAVERRPAP